MQPFLHTMCIDNLLANRSLNILAVDDEPFNLEILSEWILGWGANVDTAENGVQALAKLESSERVYDAILLDRMMPEMDGFEFLEIKKQQSRWREIPVIMQSAAATVDEINHAFTVGIWYYLSKPFDRRKLCSIIEAAVADATIHGELRRRVSESSACQSTQYDVRTLDQVCDTAVSLAKFSAKPENTVIGLYELLLNAVEHGNLEIGYNEKTRLLLEHGWLAHIDERLNRSPYSDRVAHISVTEHESGILYLLKDQGSGFKSAPYQQLQTHRAADNHGRGIAFARQLSFSALEYRSGGNEVLALCAGDTQ